MTLASRVLLITLIFACSCKFPKFKNPNEEPLDLPKYAVVFNHIDETAVLVINGTEVYKNEQVVRPADDPIVLDINEHLGVGENVIEITLSDTPEGQCLNNEWGINFDIYVNGELFDYWQERNEEADCEDGVKVVKEYTLEIESL